MRKVKFYSTLIIFLLSAMFCNAQNNLKTTISDFNKLSGRWSGTLTYLDYKSGKPYTMPADLIIKRIDKTNHYVISNIYPNETNANSTDIIAVSADGKLINGKLIKSRRALENGKVEFITEELGKDGNENKEALIRLTYVFNQNSFSKRKDIKFVGETEWIKRHEYLYTRKSTK